MTTAKPKRLNRWPSKLLQSRGIMIREMLSCLTGKHATEVLSISFHGFTLKLPIGPVHIGFSSVGAAHIGIAKAAFISIQQKCS
jgi:hypothetical protein